MAVSSQRPQRGCLHHIDGQRLYASVGNQVLVGNVGERLGILAELPLSRSDALCASQRLLGRLLRRHLYHVVPFRDRVVAMGFSQIWCFDAETGQPLGDPVPVVGRRPLALCVTPHGLYYGEYRDNRERSPIRVLFSDDALHWRVVRELTGVRHIHGVYYDRYTNGVWITTGDEDKESAIWHSVDRLETVEQVVSGSQQTRAISLLFTEKYVFFGSDTPTEVNHIYRLHRDSLKLDALTTVAGSVFYGARAGSCLLFSTAVEPSERNTSRDAVLYRSTDGETWDVAARHSKDSWHAKYFQYGQLVLPSGDNETGRYWYSTFAARPDYNIFSGLLDGQ